MFVSFVQIMLRYVCSGYVNGRWRLIRCLQMRHSTTRNRSACAKIWQCPCSAAHFAELVLLLVPSRGSQAPTAVVVLAVDDGRSLICLIRYDFSSENCSSSVRSARKLGRKSSKRWRFMINSRLTSADLFGLAANIYPMLVLAHGSSR